MNGFTCCKGHDAGQVPCNQTVNDPGKGDILKRAGRFIKPVLPAFLLAIVPKCPFCLAAYVALGTGIGLSVTSAVYLHMFLLFAGIIPISLFVANYISTRFYSARPAKKQLFTGMLGTLIGCSLLLIF
jgi:hypothetical protein